MKNKSIRFKNNNFSRSLIRSLISMEKW